MNVRAVKTRIFREGEDLERFIMAHVQKLKEGSILVVTSKIVALAEGRTAERRSEKAREKLIHAESEAAMKTRYVWLTLKDGMAMADAGIDSSNAGGKLILLPEDSFRTAKRLREALRKRYKVKKLGVLITDSRTYPLRAGVTGIALGYAGFRGVRDYRNTPDIFGRIFRYSRANIADGLSTASVAVMGEGRERQPLAVIEGAPVEFRENVRRSELRIPLKDDMYLPFLTSLVKPRKR